MHVLFIHTEAASVHPCAYAIWVVFVWKGWMYCTTTGKNILSWVYRAYPRLQSTPYFSEEC